jgi:hypothetical protein
MKKDKSGKEIETVIGIGVACVVRLQVPSLNISIEETGACSACNATREKTFSAFDTCIKGAVSDGFKRCLRYLGPGRELYPDSDFASKPSNKDFVPQLPLMGLTALTTILNISMGELVKNVTEHYKMDKVSVADIPNDPELARELLNKAKALYLKNEV